MISDASILKARQDLQRCGVPADDLSDEQIVWYIRERDARQAQLPVYAGMDWRHIGYLRYHLPPGQMDIILRHVPAVHPITLTPGYARSGPSTLPRADIVRLRVANSTQGQSLVFEAGDISWLFQAPDFSPLRSYWEGTQCPVCKRGALEHYYSGANRIPSLICGNGRYGFDRDPCFYSKQITSPEERRSLVSSMLQMARANGAT